MLESLFNKIAGLALQHRCFPVKLAKFLGIYFSTEHLWLLLLKSKKVLIFSISNGYWKESIYQQNMSFVQLKFAEWWSALQYLPKWIIFFHIFIVLTYFLVFMAMSRDIFCAELYNKSASYFISMMYFFFDLCKYQHKSKITYDLK